MRKSWAWNEYASVHTASAINAEVAYTPARVAGKSCGRERPAISATANVYAALTMIAHSTKLPKTGSSIAGMTGTPCRSGLPPKQEEGVGRPRGGTAACEG